MTSNSKHTPGPWKVFNGTDIFPDDVDLDGTRHIADFSMAGSQFISGDEKRANARLSAAAPDLLEALYATRKIVAEAASVGFNYTDGDWAVRLYVNQALLSAAIAKAEGRT